MSLRKKPWNRIDLPVYSIGSFDDEGCWNMNIITYASQVSMRPKQFICGIYYNTKTLNNINRNPVFILQLLAAEQYNLVHTLGRRSGFTYDKIAYLVKRGLLEQWKTYSILSDAIAVMEMHATTVEITNRNKPDHQLFLCDVVDYKNLNEGSALTLNMLREKNIIRI